ncbi:phosphotransferase enzyme family protein, partial [Teratosphaeria destructans]
MRNVLNTPAPRVLAWDASDKTAVNAEYIIMEKAKGVQLSIAWPRMKFQQKVQLMKAVGRYEKAWASTSFDRIGSLYYADDVQLDVRRALVYIDETGKQVQDDRFSVGPIVSREWNDHGRASLSCDRGPWLSNPSYRRAVIERDIRATTTLRPLPKSLTSLCGPSLYQSTPEKKFRACEAALQALPHILPQEPWASKPHLWHDDLHDENISVDADDPTKVTSIIDWQSSFIAPLFDHGMLPAFLQYDGPPVKGAERPTVPDLSDLGPDEEAAAIRLYDEQLLVCGYKFLLQHTVESAYSAQLYQESESATALNACRDVFAPAAEGACLVALADSDKLPDPIFSETEIKEIEEDAEKIMASLHVMAAIKNKLGDLFPEKGLVRLDEYDDAKVALRNAKAQILEDFSVSEEDRRGWEEAWPFDD